ncbi:MAG: glycosyl hydrolase 2 galactose-binding domain-containing protein [Bullifex sp.]
MKIQTLDGKWSLKPADHAAISRNTAYFNENETIDMNLPGDVHSTLLEHGIIKDPYYAKDELDTLWVGQNDWTVSRDFTYEKEEGRTILSLTRVDTVSEVILNGIEVGRTDNFFARWDFDVTDKLRNGENSIEFRFESAEKLALKRNGELAYPIPCSLYPNGSPNRNLVRKTQCHAGWDWGPCVMATGIYDPIRLVNVKELYVTSWNCIPTLKDHSWICRVEVSADVFEECDVDFNIELAGRKEHTVTHVKPSEKNYSFTFVIPEEDVELWWPAGQGGQHLYPLSVSFGDFSDRRMTAFRTLVIKNSVTMGGKELTVSVNGKDIFMKGMNWIPMDALPSRITTSRYIKLLQGLVDANMNMVRLWGGGFYENEAFYDTCDRLGILIWHDLMFACSTYPSDEWFLKSVEKELEYQIPRLKSHPSIALWCGNNEDLGALTWYEESIKNRDRYVMDYDRLNEGVCGRLVRKLDPSRVFWPSSPCAGPGDFSDNWHTDGSGDMHFWSVWHEGAPFEKYRTVRPRFCSEFGYQSFPSLSTVKGYCPEDELNLTSPVMEHHQKNPRGNSIILENFSRYFRFPSSLEKMIYLSQAQQAFAMQTACEYWRSLRPYCMGTLIWQLNDNWPVASWSAVEYSGKWKLLMYHARNFFAPIAPIGYIMDGKLKVFVTNDTDRDEEVKVSVKFSTFRGEKVRHHVFRITAPAQSVSAVTECDLTGIKSETTFAYLKVSTPTIYRESQIFLTEPKKAEMQDPELKTVVRRVGKSFQVEVSCTRPAFWVSLDAGEIKGIFSDNMFSVRPTAQHVVSFTPEEDVTEEEFTAALKVYDLYWAGH